MKNHIKKYVLIFGTVVIVGLIISSACAVNVVNEQTMKDANDVEQSEVYVDPNIKLTKKQLPLIITSIKSINNSSIVNFLSSIIIELEKNGVIDSEGIKRIIDNSSKGLILKGIHFGLLEVSAPGFALCPSSLILPFIKVLFTSGTFAIAKGGVTNWFAFNAGDQPDYYIDTTIDNVFNSYQYTSPHIGLSLGFIGICMTGWGGHNLQTLHNRAVMFGWAPLIIII